MATKPADCIKPTRNTVHTMLDMHDFADECVQVFCPLTGYGHAELKSSHTPFIDESQGPLAILTEDDIGNDTANTRAPPVQAGAPSAGRR